MRWRGPSGGLGPRIIGLALGCTLLPVVAAIGLLVGLDDSHDMVGRLLEDRTQALLSQVDDGLRMQHHEVEALASALAAMSDGTLDGPRATSVVHRWAKARPRVVGVALTDAAGRVLASHGANGAALADVRAPKALAAGAKVRWTGPAKTAWLSDPNALTLNLTAPLTAPNGRVLGALHTAVDFAWVEAIFVDAYPGLVRSFGTEDIELTLLDPTGTFIVDYDPHLAGTKEHKRDFKVLLEKNLVKMGVEIARRAVEDGGTGYLVSEHARKRIDQLGGYAHSTGAHGLDWSALIRVREDALSLGVGAVLLPTIILCLIASLLALVAAVSFARSVTQPVNEVLQSIQSASQGDLRHPPTVDSDDEVGAMSAGFRDMLGKLRARLTKVQSQGSDLNDAAEHLNHLANQLNFEAEEMRAQAQGASNSTGQVCGRMSEVAGLIEDASSTLVGVAAAVEELSTTLHTVANSSSGLDANVSTIAAALEQMNSNLGEIGHRAEQTVGSTERAADEVRSIEARMRSFDERVREVDRVLHVIQEVAAQTNLLALNATIEAASAGAAGRAFEVVASEVKALSLQTAQATEGITETVSAIQSEAKDVLGATAEIVRAIEAVDQMAHEIADSVVAQGQASQEISVGITGAASSANLISNSAKEASEVAGLVAEDAERLSSSVRSVAEHARSAVTAAEQGATSVRGVHESLETVADNAGSLRAAAAQVFSTAGELDELMEQYAV